MKRTEQQNLMYAHQGAAPAADAIQKVGWHCGFVSIPKVVSVFSFSDFKAKAFRFCHFFCPRINANVMGSADRNRAAKHLRVILNEVKDPVKVHHGFFGHSGLRMTTNTLGNVIKF